MHLTVYVAELVDLIHNDLFDVLQAEAKQTVLGNPPAREQWFEDHFEQALDLVGQLQAKGTRLKFDINMDAGQVGVSLCHALADSAAQNAGVSPVFRLCDAYESGFGHGQDPAWKGENPYPAGSGDAEAFQIGFDLGRERLGLND
jgi:hypothetical protein